MSDVSERIKNMVRRQLSDHPEITNQQLFDKAKEIEPSIGELTLRQFNARYPLQVRRWEMTSADEAREKARQKRMLEQPSEQPVASLPPLEWSAGGFTSKPGSRPSPGRGLESSPKWPFARDPEPPRNGDDATEKQGLRPAAETAAGSSAADDTTPAPAVEPRRPQVQLVPDDDEDEIEAEASAGPALVEEEPEADDDVDIEVELAQDIRPGDEVREILLELAGRVVEAEGAVAWLEIGADLARYAGRIVELAEG